VGSFFSSFIAPKITQIFFLSMQRISATIAQVLFLSFWFSACADKDTTEASQFFLKGNLKLQAKDYAEAARYYTEAIAKDNDFADAYCNKGIANAKLGKTDEAINDYNKAIQLNPKLWVVYLNRAELLIDLKNTQQSAADLELIRPYYKDSANYYHLWGTLNYEQGNKAASIAMFDRALVIKPNNVEALINRGSVFSEQLNYDKAAQDFRKSLDIEPSNSLAMNNLGLILIETKQLDEAEKLIDKAISLSAQNAIFLNNKGYLKIQKNEIFEAESLIKKSLFQDSTNSYAHRNLGICLLKKNQYSLALQSLLKSYQIEPATPAIHYWLGEAYFQTGNATKACEYWQKGKSLGDTRAAAKVCK
jgi:tetratricopeptide (TPR) repeat protein